MLTDFTTPNHTSAPVLHNMDPFNIAATNDLSSMVLDLVEDDSESDDEKVEKKRGGSRAGRARNINRGREQLDEILYRQYFSANPIYDHSTFRARFRVSKPIFDKIFTALIAHDTYFTQRRDCTGLLGHSPFQKMTAAMRVLAYGVGSDAMDEKFGMAKSTVQVCMLRFCEGVNACFEDQYLRAPNVGDIKRVLQQSIARGFPGMLGSIDCSKWRWRQCPTAWQGQCREKEKVSTVTLEAIADESLWIWHAFFGMPGCLNDINVVEASPLIHNIASGMYPPPCEYVVNGVRRNKPYWLCDSIYPKWPIFIETILEPSTNKDKLFAKLQEAARKDIERAFGVLQCMWHIISTPSRFETVDTMKVVMKCVIILHNMVVEERVFAAGTDGEEFTQGIFVGSAYAPMWKGMVPMSGGSSGSDAPGTLAGRCAMEGFKKRTEEHDMTKRLLKEHIWNAHGEV